MPYDSMTQWIPVDRHLIGGSTTVRRKMRYYFETFERRDRFIFTSPMECERFLLAMCESIFNGSSILNEWNDFTTQVIRKSIKQNRSLWNVIVKVNHSTTTTKKYSIVIVLQFKLCFVSLRFCSHNSQHTIVRTKMNKCFKWNPCKYTINLNANK